MSVPRNRAAFQDLANSQLLKLLSARPAGSTAPWLPLPIPPGELRHLSGQEWLLSKKLQELQIGDFPKYGTTFWNRPTPETARAVWDQFHGSFGNETFALTLSDLTDPWPESWEPTEEERTTHNTTTMQAFTLVLATVARLGEAHQLLTQNRFLTALCNAWSDTWRLAVESGRAGSLFHLTPETWTACRRDLLRLRISIPKLWALLSPLSLKDGINPLFWLEGDGEEGGGEGGAYRIRLRDGTPDWREFTNLILKDLSFKGQQPPKIHYENPYHRLPILRHKPAVGKRPLRRDIVAEKPCYVVTVGAQTNKVIEALESSAVLLDVHAFQADYTNASHAMGEVWGQLERMGLTPGVLSLRRSWVRGRLDSTHREQAIRRAKKKGLIRYCRWRRVVRKASARHGGRPYPAP